MSATLMLALAASIISGYAGDTVPASVIAFSPAEQLIWIGNQSYLLEAGSTKNIHVPIILHEDMSQYIISVKTDSTTYQLPLDVKIKKRTPIPWWLVGIPLLIALASIKFRRIRAGNS